MATDKNVIFETMIAGEDLSAAAKRYCGLKFDPTTEGEALLTTAVTDVMAGILYEGNTEGGQILVAVGGRCLFRGSETLAQGNKIGPGAAADGELDLVAPGTDKTAIVCGVVREGCTDGTIGSALMDFGGQHIAVLSN